MFSYSRWLQMPLSLRIQIADVFKIEKKGPTEVFNNEIKSDGYLIKDVENALTLVALQHYLGTQETDHAILWDYLIEKIDGRYVAKPLNMVTSDEQTRMNKEYAERTGKEAPKPEFIEIKPGIDGLIQQVEENKATPTLDAVLKKHKGRPKGSKNKK